eukprot:1192225-Prorocentrum_minimum.AAC.5
MYLNQRAIGLLRNFLKQAYAPTKYLSVIQQNPRTSIFTCDSPDPSCFVFTAVSHRPLFEHYRVTQPPPSLYSPSRPQPPVHSAAGEPHAAISCVFRSVPPPSRYAAALFGFAFYKRTNDFPRIAASCCAKLLHPAPHPQPSGRHPTKLKNVTRCELVQRLNDSLRIFFTYL